MKQLNGAGEDNANNKRRLKCRRKTLLQKKNAFVAILMAVVVMLNVLICPVFAEYNKRHLTKEVVNFNNDIVHMLCDNLGLEVD